MTICEDCNEYRYDNSSGKDEVTKKDPEILSSWGSEGRDNPFLPEGLLSIEAEKKMEIWKAGGGWRLGDDYYNEGLAEGDKKETKVYQVLQ